MTREELEHKIAVLMGGRAAEKLIFDHLSTGAADDMAKATDIARNMVTRYGMDEKLGAVTYDINKSGFLGETPIPATERRFSENTACEIDLAVRAIIHQLFENSLKILRDNRDILEHCAAALLAKETLAESDLQNLTQGLRCKAVTMSLDDKK